MRTRLTGLLLAVAMVAVAALPLAALAQDPGTTTTPTPGEPTPTPSASPTPTPTPDPEAEAKARQDAKDRKRKVVRRIYRDFERDGRISACDHSRKALRITRRSISDSYDEDFPDFREALRAAIDRHKKGKCEPLPEDTPDVEPTPTATPESGSLDQGSAPPAPPPPAPPPVAPAPAPESGALPETGGTKPDLFPSPPDEGVIPEGTPAPQATPAPTPAGPPRLIVTRSANNANLLVPGMMLAIALAGLLIAAGTAVAGKRSGRFAGVGHAWREAAWRTSGTWADFTDWLRSGR